MNTLDNYKSNYYLHAQCFNHIYKTSDGFVLPPQSILIRIIEIITEYHTISKFAFTNNKTEYINKLKRMNYTKYGTYKIIMSTPIIRSDKLIITP